MKDNCLEPACLYLRKSREDQEAEARGEGETLAKHRKALFKHAKSLGASIARVFEEIVSGESLIHRPEMLAMLKEVEDGRWRSVWCMDVDRLGRGGMQDQGLILETFKKAGALIVTPRKTYDLNDEFDEEYTEFEAFMARKELKIITRRLQGGRRRSAEEGNYIGTRPPYGYLIEKGACGRTLVPHAEQAQVVRLIFALYVGGMGSVKIAKELNRLGHQTFSGKAWDASAILFILKNEVYIGRIQWRKREAKKSAAPGKKEDVRTRPRAEWIDVPGKHPPLVDAGTFAAAREMLKGKYHVPYQSVNGQVNPLAGLIKCDMCGASLVLRPYAGQRPHLICYNPRCPNKSTRFEYVERELVDSLGYWLSRYRAEWGENPAEANATGIIEIKEQSLRRLKKEFAELTQQKDRLHDLLEKRLYDEETYRERSQKLAGRLRETRAAITETETVLAKEAQREEAGQDIIPAAENLLDVYGQITDQAAKNRMLKAILAYATYRKEKWQQGYDFTLVLYPKMPQ